MDEVKGFQPLGPEGIQRRIQEIQARMASVIGKPKTPGFEFDGALKPFDPHSPGVNIKAFEASPEMRTKIETAAQANNVDPNLLDALISAESSYDPGARSRAGAMGLSQLMPDTARSLGVTDPFDATQSLHGGAKYLRRLLDQFNDIPKALAAYNAGPGAVTKHGGIPPYAETQAYVQKIMALYNSRKPL